MSDKKEMLIKIQLGELPTANEVRELENEYNLSNVSFRVCLTWMSEFSLVLNGCNLTGDYQYPLHWSIKSLWNGVKSAEKNGDASIKLFHQEYPNPHLPFHTLRLGRDGTAMFQWSAALSDKPQCFGGEVSMIFDLDFQALKSAVTENKERYLEHLQLEFPEFQGDWISGNNAHFESFE